MAEKCTHSCSDCAVLACRSKDESKYPAFCLTGKVDPALLEKALRLRFRYSGCTTCDAGNQNH